MTSNYMRLGQGGGADRAGAGVSAEETSDAEAIESVADFVTGAVQWPDE